MQYCSNDVSIKVFITAIRKRILIEQTINAYHYTLAYLFNVISIIDSHKIMLLHSRLWFHTYFEIDMQIEIYVPRVSQREKE